MTEPVTTVEMQGLPSFARKLRESSRQAIKRFLAQIGKQGERQLEFADLYDRLPTDADRVALIQMRAPRTTPAAKRTPTVAAALSAEELTALEEKWDAASDKSRARAEKHVSYVRDVAETAELKLEELAGLEGGDLNRVCKEIAARHGVDWFTVKRAVIKVRNRPTEIWAFLLLDKNRGRSRHEYGREWDRYFRSYYLVKTAPAASICRDNACKSITKMDVESARRAGIRVPTARALLDRLRAELSDEAILLARCGADAVAARHYQTRDYSSLVAGEALNGDGHRCDWFAKWPDGYVGRPILFAFQCLYTGAIVGWHVDRTENAELVRCAAAEACRKALPRLMTLDNGRGPAALSLTGGVSVGHGGRFRFKSGIGDGIGVFRQLGIDVRFTTPYQGRSKKIERAWGDIESCLRGRAELRLADAGNEKHAAAENASAHAVPLETFIRVLGEEIVSYNARGRDELWQRSVASGAVLRKASEAQLRWLLLPTQKVKVHKRDGCLRLFKNRYEPTEDPAAIQAGHRIIAGEAVVVRFNPARLFDALYLYDREGHFLGTAKCVAPVGFADHAAARETTRLNGVRNRALRTELEAQDLLDSIALAGTLPQIEPPAPAAAKVLWPFRSPIEPPRAAEPEIFDSSLDIYDDEQIA